jgi:hypothetical protein
MVDLSLTLSEMRFLRQHLQRVYPILGEAVLKQTDSSHRLTLDDSTARWLLICLHNLTTTPKRHEKHMRDRKEAARLRSKLEVSLGYRLRHLDQQLDARSLRDRRRPPQ